MSASHSFHDRTKVQVDQTVCRSSKEELRELNHCSNRDQREQLAVRIVSNAIKRSLKPNCKIQVRKTACGYVLSITLPGSHLSEILPTEASDWILSTRENQEMDSLHFAIALPENVLRKSNQPFQSSKEQLT